MLLSRIPVQVVATDIHEYQAFADVLASGQAGALTLAQGMEPAIVALICPSGDINSVADIPAVALGHANNFAIQSIQTPAVLSDILNALEALAHQSNDFKRVRDFNAYRLDPAKLTLQMPDQRQIELTETETKLLSVLFDADGASLDKQALLHKVWGYKQGLDTHTLETHIYRLRQKIAAQDFLITTHDGYKLA
jgi:hypothetical protein